jgi:hypothetical protein
MKKEFPAWKEQIKSPKWQKKRLEVLNLRGFKCEECKNEDKTLHVHHRFYISGRLIHEYDNDVLQVLCEDCHKKEHVKKTDNTVHEEYLDLIKLIKDHKSIYNEDILYDLTFILEEICESDSSSGFITDLSMAFNNGFSEKIAIDLRMNSKIEHLSIDLSRLTNG